MNDHEFSEGKGQGFESLRARHGSAKLLRPQVVQSAQWVGSAALVSSGGINNANDYGSDPERTRRLRCAQEGAKETRSSYSGGDRCLQAARGLPAAVVADER